ncbi:unnamed protein product [Caenorhabditis bovis]|uniref:BTB domain-containing protein n=1 Tax=Caenorhabditis bovis TaxID=2654633 RepID=A0A8S1EHG2_9PELO|nr:unnamed protein product [Caenorhabditis bovis]
MYSRYSQMTNFPVNVILIQPTTSHETFPTDSDYVDFEAPSKYRTYPIHVMDKTFYVDSHVFSKNSDFFRAVMNNTRFIEGSLGKIEIFDEKPEDILTLIRVVSPNYLALYPTEVCESNICTVLRLCDKYLFGNLKSSCLDFLENYDPSVRPLHSVLYLFYSLAFKLHIDHDQELSMLLNVVHYSCLTELLKPSNIAEMLKIRNDMMKEDMSKFRNQIIKKIVDAVLQGNAIFEHRLSFNEEVQGLGCQQCMKLPSNRRKPFVLCLCKACGREVCVQCRKKPCWNMFEEWLNELRS